MASTAERLWPNGLLVPLPLACFCAEVGGAELIAWSAHFPTIHLYFLDSPNELDDEGIYQCPRALQQFFGITQESGVFVTKSFKNRSILSRV